MEENKHFKPISELINEIKLYAEKLEGGNLSVSELSTVLNASRELNERLVILKYKAAEKLVDDSNDGYNGRFKLNLKKDNQLSLDEVISDTVKEKLEKAQTNFLDDVDETEKVEEQTRPIEPTPVETQSSVNERFSENQSSSLGDKLKKTPISDLKQSIGINLKFLFMNDLFEGENTHYNQAVDILNSASSFEDAKMHLGELKQQFNWDDEHVSVIRFVELVERRFL